MCTFAHVRVRNSGMLFALFHYEAFRFMDRYVDLPISDLQTAELISIVVRECGCGCATSDGTVTYTNSDCFAVRILCDRRFVLGVVFARTLRQQLEDGEWCREAVEGPAAPAKASHSDRNAR
jgi:hypothetical protein